MLKQISSIFASLSLSRRKLLRGAVAVIATFGLPLGDAVADDQPEDFSRHRVLCCNIRVDLPEDAERGFGWEDRKDICMEVIRRSSPDIICAQEVLRGQMNDLQSAFPEFAAFGFDGPEMDRHATGYHGIAKNPILYSHERYELVGGGCYWLSETPTIGGSKSWETARARHANWLRLRDRRTGREFRVINTHLDHVSQGAREKQVGMILEESGQYGADFPQIFCGDFNATMKNRIFGLIQEAGWTDTFGAIHGSADPGFTVHGFLGAKKAETGKTKGKIDFIFVRGGITPLEAAVVRDEVGGRYPSDHYFVSAVVEF